MSQDYNQRMFKFSNGFERTTQQQFQQQIRRDKLRIQGFEHPPLIGMEEDEETSVVLPAYESAGMLSEMFSFPSGGVVASATELLENQISQSYRNPRPPTPQSGTDSAADWFLHHQGTVVGQGLVDSKNRLSNMNPDSAAAAMHLFLMNPQQQRSSPPSSSHPPPPPASSTLHMLMPNPSPSNSSNLQAFHTAASATPGGAFGQFAWVPSNGNEANPNEIPGVIEGGQGLSLSLSSSLQQMDAAKAEEMRIGEGGMMFFGQGGGSLNSEQFHFKNPGGGGSLHLHGGAVNQFGAVNVLRNSKYAKPAQELLEEFCCVGRGQFKKTKSGRQINNITTNPSSNSSGGGGGGSGGGNSSSSSKDLPPLSAADRLEHQRRKVKLISMLDEVDRRYHHYCEQMQVVVNSFDLVMGFGAAVPYTCLAQKAMSRHFRCLKDAIATQLKHNCEQLGEKDASTCGVTKGETPRLKILDQNLRHRRAFHQMGIIEQEAWRPQRGLPERSVNILRAWLFEHFLHPYPSDADKHLLARQTGLSRNQVSNWFINARVRLWKPMIEDMYQQEAKDIDEEGEGDHSSGSGSSSAEAGAGGGTTNNSTQTPMSATATAVITPITAAGARSKSYEFNASENDLSSIAINAQCFSENQAKMMANLNNNVINSMMSSHAPPQYFQQNSAGIMNHPGNADIESSTLLRFGTNAGDVSLTLGLRHAGNLPEKSPFYC